MLNPTPQDADPSDELPPWPNGHVIFGPYVVKGELGRGGMGRVYLAEHRTNGDQFAAKRALVRGAEAQRALFKELLRWKDLPRHPHLVACAFFRTINNEIVIFADYVAGGTLSKAIAERRITGLAQLLDIAIQCAWGLQAIHDHGLVHADMKPGNVLLTPNGEAKVTDFGIARAGGPAADGTPRPFRQWITVGGGTILYRSPEQSVQRPLTPASDLWSWGLTVLQMFQGGCTWERGEEAPSAFEQYLQTGPANPPLPAMPSTLVDLLRRCFHPDPARRGGSLREAAEALIALNQRELGQPYPRHRPVSPARGGSVVQGWRRSLFGAEWDDPREWLLVALMASGRDPAEVEAILPPDAASRMGKAIADLAVFAEAHRILTDLVAAGRRDLEPNLASLCIHRALAHQTTEDTPGALAAYDQALGILEPLIREGRGELANDLARTYMNKAVALRALGDLRGALAAHDQALAIREPLVREGRGELRGELAWTRALRAGTLRAIRDMKAARGEARAAIPVLQTEVKRTGRADLKRVLEWAQKTLGDLL